MTVAELLDALHALDQLGPDAPVIIIGPGDQRWEIDYVSEEQLLGTVTIVARPTPPAFRP